MNLPPNIEAALRLVFSRPSPELIQQNEWELRTLLEKILLELKPSKTIEIGTWHGTNAAILSLVTSGITLSLDLIDYGHKELAESIARENGKTLVFKLSDSRSEKAVEEVRQVMGPTVDLLFIDDGHGYESISCQHRIWGKLVRPGGWIVFHDINFDANQYAPGKHSDEMRAPYYWNDIDGNKEEIIFRGTPSGAGIGILRL